MVDVRKLSGATLKEWYGHMVQRMRSCVQNPEEEAEYQTQSGDWQEQFKEIEGEMKRRGLL